MGTHPIFESDFDCLTVQMDYESTLLTKPECLVYRLPPRTTVRGYRAADWGLDKPAWTGRMRVIAKGKHVSIKLEDKNNGQLFAEAPITEFPTKSIEPVSDSSRYFVLKIENQGRTAFIGVGFADRSDSFDFNVALQDHFKWVKNADAPAEQAPQPALNLGLQAGQTIKINLSGKLGDQKRERPKPASTGGALLLPPPPGGSRISSQAAANSSPVIASNGSISSSSNAPQDDEFGDFASSSDLGVAPGGAGGGGNWVSF